METLQRTANRGSISTGPYEIDNSLKLEDDNTENLYRALNGSTSTTKFTVSMWFKRTELGASQLLYMRGVAGNEAVFLRTSTEVNDALQVDIGASSTNSRSYTTQLLRDTSAWYHVVLAVDTTQSTDTNRFKLYLNGNLITDFASRNNPAEDFAMEVSSAKHRHGAYNDTDGFAGYCGYIAECHYIDGSQVAQTEFGEFDDDTGIWKPKAYTGSYGTGGYYLDFSDSSALGNNSAGDGTDFTLNNIAAADQATDTPTNNFCTLNPLNVNSATASNNPTISEGATYHQSTLADHWQPSVGTIGFTAGKWYFEGKIKDSNTNHGNISFGMGDEGDIENWGRNNDFPDASGSKSLGYIGTDTPTFDHNDIISVAVDADNGKVYFAKNNTYINSGDPAAGSNGVSIPTGGDANGTYLFGIGGYKHNNYAEIQVNFGGYTAMTISSAASDANGYGTFEYAPPSGYYALCTKNLAEYG